MAECKDCGDGVWVCGEDPECNNELARKKDDWTFVSCQAYVADGYYVKCRPGACSAKLETDSGTDPGWFVVGQLTLEAGNYELSCRTGGLPAGCDVRVKTVANC